MAMTTPVFSDSRGTMRFVMGRSHEVRLASSGGCSIRLLPWLSLMCNSVRIIA